METLTNEQDTTLAEGAEGQAPPEPELTSFAGRLMTQDEALQVAGEASYEGMGT